MQLAPLVQSLPYGAGCNDSNPLVSDRRRYSTWFSPLNSPLSNFQCRAKRNCHLTISLLPHRLGLDSLLLRTSPALKHQLAEPLAPVIVALIKSGHYTHLAGPHSALGKNVFPRVAGLLEVQQVRSFQTVSIKSRKEEVADPILVMDRSRMSWELKDLILLRDQFMLETLLPPSNH